MQLRLSKYDPQYRNEFWHYKRDEWTEYTDVGKICDGVLLTREEYERVELLYLEVIRYSFEQSGVQMLKIERVERYSSKPPLSPEVDVIFKRRTIHNKDEVTLIAQAILRLEFWAELVSPKKGELKVYLTSNFYLYIESDNREFLEDVRRNLPEGIYVG